MAQDAILQSSLVLADNRQKHPLVLGERMSASAVPHAWSDDLVYRCRPPPVLQFSPGSLSADGKYIQTRSRSSDKGFVNSFVDNAVQIFDAAENTVRSGHTPSDMTILISAEGGIRMVADSDWPLDSLQAHHGARMAYRVSQSASAVRVEGRAGSRTCLFETEKPERAARLLLNQSPNYNLSVVSGLEGASLMLAPPLPRVA